MTVSAYSSALTGTAHEQSLLSRIGTRIINARRAQADRAVAAYLLSLDDDTLDTLGYDRDELKARDPKGYPFL